MADKSINPSHIDPFSDLREFAIRKANDNSNDEIAIRALPKSEIIDLGTVVVQDSDPVDKHNPSRIELEKDVGGVGVFDHPFRLDLIDSTTWRVATKGSSITNDDDGSQIPIEGLGGTNTETGYVYIQCDISSGTGTPTGTASVVVGGVRPEIQFTGADQTEANLLIGIISRDGSGSVTVASQMYNNAALLSRTFDSGNLVWTFIAHPSHPNAPQT